jgi:hypothetical protein
MLSARIKEWLDLQVSTGGDDDLIEMFSQWFVEAQLIENILIERGPQLLDRDNIPRGEGEYLFWNCDENRWEMDAWIEDDLEEEDSPYTHWALVPSRPR